MRCWLQRWSSDADWTTLDSVADFPPEKSDLVLYFADREELLRAGDALKRLVEQHPDALIVGCSAAGEILGGSVHSNGISAMCFSLESSSVRLSSIGIDANSESLQAGEVLAAGLAGPDLQGVMILSDGTMVNGTELVEGLLNKLPDGVPLFGGLAGDGDRFASTLVGIGADLQAGRIVAVGFYGASLEISCGSAGGWESFGPLRRITSARNNVLVELDGEPALAVYKRYLGERASELPSAALRFPLEVYVHGPDREGVVRTILTIDEKTQTMTFAGDMPEGALARLMTAGPDRLIQGACLAAERAHAAPGPVDAAILVSCVGRRLVLRQRVEDEVEEVLSVVGAGTPAIGFYSYGELSPSNPGARSGLHNQTMTLTLFREGAEG